MRVLFASSRRCGESADFARDFVRELKAYAEVVWVCFDFDGSGGDDCDFDYVFRTTAVFEAFSPEGKILEAAASLRFSVDFLLREFSPDVIHCCDRKAFLPFRFDGNVFYSAHFDSFSDSSCRDGTFSEGGLGSDGGLNFDFCLEDMKVERCALKGASVVAVYSDFAARSAERMTGGMCVPIVMPAGVRAERLLRLPERIGRKDVFMAESFHGGEDLCGETCKGGDVACNGDDVACNGTCKCGNGSCNDGDCVCNGEVLQSDGFLYGKKQYECGGFTGPVEVFQEAASFGNLAPRVFLFGGLSETRLSSHSGRSPAHSGRFSARRKLKISYFGRLENERHGVNDFIYSVNILGADFKKKYNVEYSLYGEGELSPALDLGLFDDVRPLDLSAMCEAYRACDISVFPSRCESFGFSALKSMAAGNLVLLTVGLGMDEFAVPGYNCIEIPRDVNGIAMVLRDAVFDFDRHRILRENAVRTAVGWSWKRSVRSHLYVYRELSKGRASQLCSAYRTEEREVVKKFREASDVEKLYASENERRLLFKILVKLCSVRDYGFCGRGKNTPGGKSWSARADFFDVPLGSMSEIDVESFSDFLRVFEKTGKKILVLTGVYAPERGTFTKNVEVFSVLNEGAEGITVRLECLPFDDGEFDVVVLCGAWESVLDPCGALVEAERVCSENLLVLYGTAMPHPWQTYQIEDDSDWEKLTGSGWKFSCVERCDSNVWGAYKIARFERRGRADAKDGKTESTA